MLADHWARRARSVYDAAIQTVLMLRTAFKLALRQSEGLMTSVLSLMGLTISAPDHTTVSRRAARLPVIQAPLVPRGPHPLGRSVRGTAVRGIRRGSHRGIGAP